MLRQSWCISLPTCIVLLVDEPARLVYDEQAEYPVPTAGVAASASDRGHCRGGPEAKSSHEKLQSWKSLDAASLLDNPSRHSDSKPNIHDSTLLFTAIFTPQRLQDTSCKPHEEGCQGA